MLLAIPAELPALPLHTAGKYVAAAYVVLFVLVLIYVAIMAIRLSHIERELGELLEIADRGVAGRENAPPAAGPSGQALATTTEPEPSRPESTLA
jgi:hypothetical protein